MFGKKKAFKSARIDTLIGQGTEINGDLVFSGGLHVDGKINGNVMAEKGSTAIPHSQRSYANVWVKLSGDPAEFPFYQLVDIIESVLKTPVQTAAKREDEQEFARLNGANQMFCEDAARRIKNHLSQQSQFEDFWIRVEHLESLHAHDAVAITVKGIDNGYSPLLHR